MRAFYKTNSPQVLASGTEQREPSGQGLTSGRDRNRSGTRSPGGASTSHTLISNRGLTLAFLAFVAVLAAGLLFLMPGGLLQAQDTAETFYHNENDEGAVVTLAAEDPEGVSSIHWDFLEDATGLQDLPGGVVDGAPTEAAGVGDGTADDIAAADVVDFGDFTINGGVLKFNDAPDFEDPADSDTNNVYNVVVRASDGGRGTVAGRPGWMQYFKVTVTVLDVEETGKVTWTVDPDGTADTTEEAQNLLEFQAGAFLTATVTDPDGPETIVAATTSWQWYRSSSMSGPWTPISNATTNTYIASDEANNDDRNMYLRASATYADRRGANKQAPFVSKWPVQPAKVQDNTIPEFSPTAIEREIQEGKAGMIVGAPVTATDADGDVRNYTLVPGNDKALFKIDQETGQITTAAKLDFEKPSDDGGTPDDNIYVVTVRATDSAGGNTGDTGGNADATVTITVLDVNEPPEFVAFEAAEGVGTVPDNVEGMANDKPEEGMGVPWNGVVSEYKVDDPEGVVINGDKWSLKGDDAALFKLTGNTDNQKTLEFREKADFENPGDRNRDNVYEVTVVASDVEETAERDVTVKVTDSNEVGMITLSTLNPVTGTEVTATLEDSDGQVINVVWKLHRLDTLPANAAALDAKLRAEGVPVSREAADEGTTYSFIPGSGDIDKYLVAQAAYMDRTEDTDNDFTAVQIRAGFIRFDNLATSLVTARVVDDPANAAPMFVEGSTATRYVEEDAEHDGPIDPESGRRTRASEPIGAELKITDADGDGDSHTWALGGPDAASFDIDAANGQLMTKAALDYERKSTYTVVVTVQDGSGKPNDTDRITVTIQVKDLDEKPEIAGMNNEMHNENDEGAVVTLAAGDPEGVSPIYWDFLEDATGLQDLPGGVVDGTPTEAAGVGDGTADDIAAADVVDFGDFTIDGGVLKFNDAPDFEDPADSDTNNVYNVVVRASDGGAGTVAGRPGWVQYFKVTVTVLDVEETGKVTWTVGYDEAAPADAVLPQDLLEFQAGAFLTATVTDPDGPETIVAATTSWQWYRSSSMSGPWTPISNATTNTYIASDKANNDDRNMYLRASATYADRRSGTNTNKRAAFVSPNQVRPAKVEDNTIPEFAPTEHVRRVQEGNAGMIVGAPVTATDADGDMRNYTLVDENDAGSFKIDQETGQITTAAKLDYEIPADVDVTDPTNAAANNQYVITVRATDSARGNTGDTGGNADATVTIIVLNVNDPPEFVAFDTAEGVGTVPDNVEGMANDKPEEGMGVPWNGVVSEYKVDDPEGVVINGDKWSLKGDDAALFKLTGNTDNQKTLEFREKADFENPGDRNRDNVYEVTVVASDVEETAERDVTVKVTDSNEVGMITLSTLNPVTGTEVTATLEDSDGQVINVVWKLHRLDTLPANAAALDAKLRAEGVQSPARPRTRALRTPSSPGLATSASTWWRRPRTWTGPKILTTTSPPSKSGQASSGSITWRHP